MFPVFPLYHMLLPDRRPDIHSRAVLHQMHIKNIMLLTTVARSTRPHDRLLSCLMLMTRVIFHSMGLDTISRSMLQ